MVSIAAGLQMARITMRALPMPWNLQRYFLPCNAMQLLRALVSTISSLIVTVTVAVSQWFRVKSSFLVGASARNCICAVDIHRVSRIA
jgi:hypothetical protein